MLETFSTSMNGTHNYVWIFTSEYCFNFLLTSYVTCMKTKLIVHSLEPSWQDNSMNNMVLHKSDSQRFILRTQG